ANAVKTQGKHMFGIAVGTDLNVNNIISISGPDNFANTPSIYTDDYSVGNFAGLSAQLTSVVNTICGTEISIDKTVSTGTYCSGSTATFTFTVTNTGGSFGYDATNVVLSDVFPNGFTN